MKKFFIVANWKSNKTASQALEWFTEVQKTPISDNKEVVVCASFTLLSDLKSLILNLKSPFRLGAQDVSPFEEGAYTGEVNAQQIKEFAEYVLIGHSERRTNFHEDDPLIQKKVENALSSKLLPILCVQNENTEIPQGVTIVAYEPTFAIGTGQADTPENAETVASRIKENKNIQFVLYGGSVTSENVGTFTNMPSLDGVLVGGASLNAEEFAQIIKNA